MSKKTTFLCPCGSGLSFEACCKAYLSDGVQKGRAPTPQALMRSRYSAYALGDEAYLLASWHASTRPTFIWEKDEPRLKWIALTIHDSQTHGDEGFVDFTAKARSSAGAVVLREKSRFLRENDQWFYVDGEIR